MKDILSTEREKCLNGEFLAKILKDNFPLLEHKLSGIRRENFLLAEVSALKVQTNVEVLLQEENQAGMLALS